MIEILKPGQTKFTATCNNCGCEFTYELEDITLNSDVPCPCCHKMVPHKKKNDYIPYWPEGVRGIPSNIELTPYKDTKLTDGDPCENCEWHRKMLMNKEPYIGDSPCQWCQHYPYKITCESVNKHC